MTNIVILLLMIHQNGRVILIFINPHSGVALETQYLPNDINNEGNKAKSILKANVPFYAKTIYHISEK